MPIATAKIYGEMLTRAREARFAYPSVNVTSSQTLHAARRGFAEASSDGIVQVSTGGAAYFSGASVNNMVTGAVAFAQFARTVAAKYPVQVALHTDHCRPDKLDGYVRPLLDISRKRAAAGDEPVLLSHMWDGSTLSIGDNLETAEEDGIVGAINEKLYSTPEDAMRVVEALGLGEHGRYLLAATFGNVHGAYQPGHVTLGPAVLADIQKAVGARYGRANPFDLVFHGGSGSPLSDIREAIGFGVVKMNIDTDMQYAFTRPIADHVLKHYDGVIQVDGEVGEIKYYDPRSWGRSAEAGMARRVVQACQDLGSAGSQLTST
jgi:fructose-bisphosphate aldolase, class II